MDLTATKNEEKQVLARKLYLMRKMLKNEKRANEMITEKLNKAMYSAHKWSSTRSLR